jgi:hypothetical protein
MFLDSQDTGLCRYNQIKMRSQCTGVAPDQRLVSLEQDNLDTESQGEGCVMAGVRAVCSDVAASQAVLVSSTSFKGKKECCCRAAETERPCQHLSSGHLISTVMKEYISVILSHSV